MAVASGRILMAMALAIPEIFYALRSSYCKYFQLSTNEFSRLSLHHLAVFGNYASYSLLQVN